MLIKRQLLIPLLQTGCIEAVKLADVANPREHPMLEFWPTARRLEKVTPDMHPAKGQNQLVILQGQAFIGTVAVTYQNDFE